MRSVFNTEVTEITDKNHRLTLGTTVTYYHITHGGVQYRFFLTRPTPSTGKRAKGKFLSVRG